MSQPGDPFASAHSDGADDTAEQPVTAFRSAAGSAAGEEATGSALSGSALAGGALPDGALSGGAVSAPPWQIEAPWGPGFFESLLWIIGFFALQTLLTLAWFLGHFALAKFGLIEANQRFSTEFTAGTLAFVQAFQVVVTLLAIRLRLGPRTFRLIGLNRFSWGHALLLTVAVLPAANFSGQCYLLANEMVEPYLNQLPLLKFLQQSSSMLAIEQLAKNASVMLLLLAVAFGPGISEELLFRGLVGRGLLWRYGLLFGVLLTTLLFSGVHISPTHVAALIPLSILLHVAYISSRSLWLPIGLHTANNALAVMSLYAADESPADPTAFQLVTFITSGLCLLTVLALLWTTRIRWVLPGGEFWQPERSTVEPPPAWLNAHPRHRRPGWVLFTLLVSLLLASVLAFGYFLGKQILEESAKRAEGQQREQTQREQERAALKARPPVVAPKPTALR